MDEMEKAKVMERFEKTVLDKINDPESLLKELDSRAYMQFPGIEKEEALEEIAKKVMKFLPDQDPNEPGKLEATKRAIKTLAAYIDKQKLEQWQAGLNQVTDTIVADITNRGDGAVIMKMQEEEGAKKVLGAILAGLKGEKKGKLAELRDGLPGKDIK